MKEHIGCLLIHGFGGNTGEVKPLKDYLDARGYNVISPVIKGHTGIRKDLSGAKYTDWIASIETELLEMKPNFQKIIIIGFSMGGLIAANLAIKHDVAAIATLSSPIYYWDIKKICKNILSDLKSKSCNNIKYYLHSSFNIPFSALVNFRILLARTKPLFRQIRCPIFVAQGLMDDTVQFRSAEFIYRNIGSELKEKKYYPQANHLICHSPDREELFEDIMKFIDKVK